MSSNETPAVKAERERRERQHDVWEKVREAARELLETQGKEAWLTTSEFSKALCHKIAVSHAVAIAVIQELRDNGEAVYVLGEGYRHVDASFIEPSIEPVARPADAQRRNDFLNFAQKLKEIHSH